MSRGFIKEGDQEAIPMVPPRAFLPEGVPNYVTKEGLAALNEELKNLEEERAKAGDNYIMGNFIDAKMKLLIGRILSAVEIDLSKANKDTVSFGAWVRYNKRVVRIVGVDEANIDNGLISFISPLAKSLTGKKAGDIIEFKGPGGTERIEVEEVSFEPLALTQLISNKPTETTVTTERPHPTSINKTIDTIVQANQLVEDNPHANDKKNNDPEPPVLTAEAVEPPRFVPEVDPMEFLPIVNERGNIIGRALYMELHQGNKILHPVTHLHVVNGKGETVRRYWWHVAFGETPEKTLKRKMTEALGISGEKPMLKRQYIRDAKTEKELVYVFTIISEKNLPETPKEKTYVEAFEKD